MDGTLGGVPPTPPCMPASAEPLFSTPTWFDGDVV